MKTCIKCGGTERNMQGNCKPCAKRIRATWYISHREEQLARCAKWAKENPDKNCAKTKKYYIEHPDKRRKGNPKWAVANPEKMRLAIRAWRRAHPEKNCAATMRHITAKLNAVPVWANSFFIEEIYDLAQRRTKATGFKWQVDHIVPLQSKLVCGLHCEANLQVIPMKVNCSKGNRYWPDMPTI